ncbi:WecB/TagA/CpsF family glycosyltransferase [Kangiella sediminilitoris]|uniref:Glycosyl transferase, WecB/TagA/CpsF family n=1 Tax=Kangiella sediminilitoris TaxID=1144748 RepID=A0A1B3BBI9_9GAMM|nr:WecB/TagA/CpsF family glycosyltransferase [Kangiella sediminilitoris]AOE50158.1 Glycosyl transferase, WecB/TagA/CpsF family [Kangiella sediminilitoris]
MSECIQTVEVGGLPVTPFKSMEQAVNTICSNEGVLPGFAVAINAEKVISASDNPDVKRNLMLGTLLYADGIAVVKTIQKKGIENTRVPGCDLWKELMKKAALNNKHVYLLGAEESVNKQTANKLSEEFGLKSLTRRNGYFGDVSQIIAEVEAIRPDIVTVAMGSPRQEQLITKLREVHPEGFYMGVGGSYDVYVGTVKRAPTLFQKLHLEWFYRLLMQPKRIFRQHVYLRYLYLHFMGKL